MMEIMVTFTRIVVNIALSLGVATVELPAAELPAPGEAMLISGNDIKTLVVQEFTRFDPHYLDNRERLGNRLDASGRQLAELQAAGNEMECSNEIYLEAKWLRQYTAEWDGLERRLVDLAKSLDQPDQDFATHQSPETGLWGPCYERGFFKLEATILALIELADMGEAPRYAIHLPRPFDTHEAAWKHFRGLLVSDVAHQGIDNRGELANIGTVASLTYLKDYIQDYLNTKVAVLPRNQGGSGAKTQQYRMEFAKYIQAWQ